VVQPHQYKHFSLIDDGQTILNTNILKDCVTTFNCSPALDVIIEKEFGRFRPLYWFIQATLQEVIGLNPARLHEFRAYVLGLILLTIIAVILYPFDRSLIGTLLAALIFFMSASFAENIIRLGPVEPYHLILISFASYVFLNRTNLADRFGSRIVIVSLVLSLIGAAMIKETTLALLGLMFMICLYERKTVISRQLLILLPVIVISLIVAVLYAKSDPSSTDYSGNYQFTVQAIIHNIYVYKLLIQQMFGSLIYIFLGLALLNQILFARDYKYLSHLLFWAGFTLSFIAIQVPWPYVLERYFLLPIFGISVCFALIFTHFYANITKKLLPLFVNRTYFRYLYSVIVITIILNIVSLYIPGQLVKSLNYAQWYQVYLRFESDQVYYLATRGRDAVVNANRSMNNWEVLFEIPIHLEYIYNIDSSIKLYDPNHLENKLIFTSSSLEQVSKIDENTYKLLEEHVYTANQINSNLFKTQFILRPLQTVVKPPLSDQPITHKWQVWSSE